MSNTNDPRVFFAAERTLLAWMRTSLGIAGMGYVLTRYEALLHTLQLQDTISKQPLGMETVGILMMFVAAAVVGVSAWQHRRFCLRLEESERPHGYRTSTAFITAILITLALVRIGLIMLGI